MVDIRVIDNQTEPLESVILLALDSAKAVKIATAFVKGSGVSRIASHVTRFLDRGGEAQFVYGLDFHITDPQAIETFVGWANEYPSLLHHAYSEWGMAVSQTFHPKLYIFTGMDNSTTVVVGSSNLTAGGIRGNTEVNTVITGLAGEGPIVQALRVFDRVRAHDQVFAPSEGWLTKYKDIHKRAKNFPVAPLPPREMAPAYRKLKQYEAQLPGVLPTQKRVIIDAIKQLPPGPDGFVSWKEIAEKAEQIARSAKADFDWATFQNSVRGRLNEHTVGKRGEDLFERKGGVEGREGRYRLTEKGRGYQGR